MDDARSETKTATDAGRCALGIGVGTRAPETVLRDAAAAGATALLVTATVTGGGPAEAAGALGPLLGFLGRQRELPVLAVEEGLGALALGRPALVRAALCALDRDEGRAAASRLVAALQAGEACGARHVIFGLGPVAALTGKWDGLRRRFLRGELLEDRTPCERLMAEHQAQAGRHVGAALRALEPVLNEAERRGLGLLVRNPRRGIELPGAVELEALLGELSGAPLRPVLDLPAAHLTSVMRLWPLRETITAFAAGPLCLLGDACGAVGGLPPGRGEVDVAAVARYLSPEVERAFVPWPGLTPAEVREGVALIKALPGRPPEPPPAAGSTTQVA